MCVDDRSVVMEVCVLFIFFLFHRHFISFFIYQYYLSRLFIFINLEYLFFTSKEEVEEDRNENK